MKVLIATESVIDEAAIRILVVAVLGTPALPVNGPPLGIRSWPGLLDLVWTVYRYAYYQTDADGLVLVADSDFSPLHEPSQADSADHEKLCRICLLRDALAKASRGIKPRPCGVPLRTTVGLTIPEISAWYLHGVKNGINEAAWANGLRNKKHPYAKVQLKRWAFGKDHLPFDEKVRIAIDHANRLAHNLVQFEQAFPIGFGSMAMELRGWV